MFVVLESIAFDVVQLSTSSCTEIDPDLLRRRKCLEHRGQWLALRRIFVLFSASVSAVMRMTVLN